MIKVKDQIGNIVRGVFRKPNGALVVNDTEMVEKYRLESEARHRDANRIVELEKTVDDLKYMVYQLLDEKRKQ